MKNEISFLIAVKFLTKKWFLKKKRPDDDLY